MSYEDANRIGQLNASYPEEDVSASGGAQHIRMIKKILRDAFQNTDEIPVDFAEIVYKDYLKDRLPIVGLGDPNGGPSPVFKGQRYFDNSTDPWTQYIAMVEGDNNSWVSEYRFGTFEVDSLTAYQDASLPEGTTVGGTDIANLATGIGLLFENVDTQFHTAVWDSISSSKQDQWNTVNIDSLFDNPDGVNAVLLHVQAKGNHSQNTGGTRVHIKPTKDEDTAQDVFNLACGSFVDTDGSSIYNVYLNAFFPLPLKGYTSTDFDYYVVDNDGVSVDLRISVVGYI